MTHTIFLPLILLILGAAGWMFVGRRRFMRRNIAGIEEFNGYASMLATRLFERCVRFFSGALLFMGVCGLAMFPGQLLRASTTNPNAPAAQVASTVAPANTRKVVRMATTCYFYDQRNRLISTQPTSSTPALRATRNNPTGCPAPGPSHA